MRQSDRFSIRGLTAVIVLFAVAFAALRYPSRFGANAWFSMTLASVTLAIPAALGSIGHDRAFWSGFAVRGWVYFMIWLAPWVH